MTIWAHHLLDTGAIHRQYRLPDEVAGTELHLPVFPPGAWFSAGDGHASQGDGEVYDTAIETALSGVFSFILQRADAPEFPEAHWRWRMNSIRPQGTRPSV